MTNKLQIIIATFILIIVTGCTEKIEIELDENYTRLVVEGNITNDTMKHTFSLSKTTSYYYNQAPPKVKDAIITITDNNGNNIQLTEETEGQYCTPDDFFGVIDRTYKMTIELNDAISEHTHYESSSNIVEVAPIDSIKMVFEPDFGREGFWVLNIYFTDPAETEDYYMFNVYQNGTLLTDSINKVGYTDDKFFNGNATNGLGIAFFNNEDQQFEVGDTVKLQMAGLNKQQFTYFIDIEKATAPQNPLFGGPPANVKGNIDNGAFGYFGAYSTTYSSVILTEENILPSY